MKPSSPGVIIVNWLKSPYEEAFVTQQDKDDCLKRDLSTRDRNRKLTEEGKEYMMETLKHHRDAAKKRLERQMKKINSFLEVLEDIELLTSEAEELDFMKEDLNQAFKQYHDLLENEKDKEASYRCFDVIDREFGECRLKISSRIYAIERKGFEEKASVKSSRSGGSRSTKSSQLTSCSARSRKIKAAANALKLEAEMNYID